MPTDGPNPKTVLRWLEQSIEAAEDAGTLEELESLAIAGEAIKRAAKKAAYYIKNNVESPPPLSETLAVATREAKDSHTPLA
jgi:hypothetical protein